MAGIFILLVVLVTQVSCHKPCTMADGECEFWFDIEYKMTMVKDGAALYPKDGKLYKYDVVNTSIAEPIPIEGVATADGWEDPRLLIVVNGQFPGPALEVFEGQTIIVHVSNSLPSESLTIHWHGLPQNGSPWMDGVSFLTQCPIMPGQSFTYRFKATPRGTFWYHTHIGLMRSMGPYGPLIIREKKQLREEEFVFTITEWNHDWDSNIAQLKEEDGMFVNRKQINPTYSLDGAEYSLFRFQSALINGKGRYYDSTGKHNEAPLEVFTVSQNASFIFRVIGVGVQYPFRISIDNHDLTIIASDGFDLQPRSAESFIVNPGERFDFRIQSDKSVNNYWIRATTLEIDVDHFGLAILRYDGAPEVDPSSSRKVCTLQSKCVVVNCPFLFYPTQSNTQCVTFDQLKSKAIDPAPPGPIGEKEEYFLNFAFPGISWKPGAVNGRTFKKPPVSALTQPQEIGLKCKDDCGDEKVCQCPYSLDLENGKVYQMIFLNMGAGKGFAHPIHMHGYSFYVLKMGYARYNATNGKIIGDNLDINCRGNADRELSFCNEATWANSSWLGGNVPGIELENPPRKDTIIVPTGGYVVVRIIADNPGLWFVHCHIELHNMDGMALVLNNSFPMIPLPPPGFPRCGNFDYNTPAAGNKRTVKKEHDDNDGDEHNTIKALDNIDALKYNNTFWAITGCLMALVVIEFLILVYTCRKATHKLKGESFDSVAMK
ncbi:hypothetical protein SNE40_014765 [Patella caerulea]|uniref:Laccase n=1 Tax=Patella caerulea TaxID=87958 RepID=A0AAN8JGA5_PATCE